MKKILSVMIALCMLMVTITACTSKEEPTGDDGRELFAERAFEFFLDVSKIPRGSGNMQAISDYLKSFGETRGLETVQDDLLNVFIKKPGSPGRENEPPVILQAHMDMVCEKNAGVEHDFLKDPILPVIEGDWVSASGTTLGADNGAGLAVVLAVLDSSDISHPPIEAVITTDEETTMAGAIGFDTSLLTGDRLVNVDYETEGVFCVSSAAADGAEIIIPIEHIAAPEGFRTYKLTIKGLAGGHSGVDIHKGLANANVLMARLLNELSAISYHLSSIDGGSSRNAIPRECTAVITVDNFTAVQGLAAQIETKYKDEFPGDSNLSIATGETDSAQTVMSEDSRQRVLDGILGTPNGVISMSADIEGLVQTSNNLGVIVTAGDTVTLSCFARSSEPSEQADTLSALRELAGSVGAGALFEYVSPAWPYRADSPLRDGLIAIYKDLYGKEPIVEAVHAALETAVFTTSMPNCDIISIGVEVQSAHSPDEKMMLSSFTRTCGFLLEILKRI